MTAPRVMSQARDVSNIVGANVKMLRHAAGWTVRELIAACQTIGWTVTPATINNIEGQLRIRKGEATTAPRREISVDELVFLGKVFRVEPAKLLKPLRVRTALVIEESAE